jgi:hypothetical protein
MYKINTYGGDIINYLKNYNDYIDYVKTLNRTKKDDVYYEIHHIKPKCMFPELIDEPTNLILLTAREHYLAHYLLWKIYDNMQMSFAFWALCTYSKSKQKVICAKCYERLKIARSKYISENQIGEKNHTYGKKQSIESNKKRSETLKKRYETQAHHRKGVSFKLTSEQIEKAAASQRKSVRCIETGIIYKSQAEAEEMTGCHHTMIGHVCIGKRENVKGFHWEYVDKHI